MSEKEYSAKSLAIEPINTIGWFLLLLVKYLGAAERTEKDLFYLGKKIFYSADDNEEELISKILEGYYDSKKNSEESKL